MANSLTLEAFDALDEYFGGLIPEVELVSQDHGGFFIEVCRYGGMAFYVAMEAEY